MRFEWVLLLAWATLGHCNEDAIDCEVAKGIRCSTHCNPVCAGNDTHKETFINGCLYMIEYCNRGLNESDYKIVDSDQGCPINCDIMRNCWTKKDVVCVKNSKGTFNQSFTNDCIFSNEYCRNHQKTLGLDYCIYRQDCW